MKKYQDDKVNTANKDKKDDKKGKTGAFDQREPGACGTYTPDRIPAEGTLFETHLAPCCADAARCR